jgi:flagellar biosynthesis/type III secretory pathway chaperone
MIDQVIDLLEQSEKLYRLLLAVIQEEKKAVLGSNPKLLAEVTAEKEALLARLNQLERQRLRLVQLLSGTLNISAERLNLSILAEKSDNGHRSRIKKLAESLGGLVKRVKQANEENRALIQHCLNLTQSAFCFFQHWMMPASVYGASGRINCGQRNGKLLSGTV